MSPCMQGKGDVEDRATNAGRPLRERRVVKPCPTCKADIADFLAHGQVNRCGNCCILPLPISSFLLVWCFLLAEDALACLVPITQANLFLEGVGRFVLCIHHFLL